MKKFLKINMKIVFRAGATGLLEDIVESFNKENDLDIKMVVDDTQEVNKVTLSSKKINASQVFALGLRYGMFVEHMKSQGHKNL